MRVELCEAPAGRAPEDYAYEVALQRSATASVPLTQAERRNAIRRLTHERPELSARAVARLVGVSHTTVTSVRADGAAPASVDASTGPRTRRATRATPAQTIVSKGYALDDMDDAAGEIATALLADQADDRESAADWADLHAQVWHEAAVRLRS